MYVATIQHLNYSRQQPTRHFAVNVSATPLTLKRGQGNQTQYELVDCKQGYNHANFEGPPLKISMKKVTLKFLSNQET